MPLDPSYISQNYMEMSMTPSRWVIGGKLAFALTGATNPELRGGGTNVLAVGFPVSDPHQVGAIWVNSGVLSVSAG